MGFHVTAASKIIKITNNLADIFWGDGWENWSRIKILRGKNPKIFYQNPKVPNDVRQSVEHVFFVKESRHD